MGTWWPCADSKVFRIPESMREEGGDLYVRHPRRYRRESIGMNQVNHRHLFPQDLLYPVETLLAGAMVGLSSLRQHEPVDFSLP